jgi:hypothetical protein
MENWASTRKKKKKFDSYLRPCIIVKPKWFVDLNVKGKAANRSECNAEYLHDLALMLIFKRLVHLPTLN